MGGHGGLNILPQKRWNVYNYENREKVRKDEEAAAKEEQLKREQSRKRDAELRLEQLRQARNINKPTAESSSYTPQAAEQPASTESSDSKHINLFEGIRIFDPIKVDTGKRDEKKGKFGNANKKMRKEEPVRTVGPEDEKYRLAYSLAGKGTKMPWYMEKKIDDSKGKNVLDEEYYYDEDKSSKPSGGNGKKSLEELREERLKRERKEKERERALIIKKSGKDGGFSSRRR